MAGPGAIPKAAQSLTTANYSLIPLDMPAPSLKPKQLDLTVRPEYIKDLPTQDQFNQAQFGLGSAKSSLSLFGESPRSHEPAPLFDQSVRNPDRPMTKGEMIDRFQEVAEERLGEDGFKVAKGLAGLGYIAKGGKVKYSKEFEVEGFDSVKMDFSASAKKGGTLGFEIKGSF